MLCPVFHAAHDALKFGIQFLGKDGYSCRSCGKRGIRSNHILNHIHSDCFPAEGNPCPMCTFKGVQNPIRLTKVAQAVEHNNKEHVNEYLYCFICAVRVNSEDIVNHVASNTNVKNVSLFEEYAQTLKDDILISKNRSLKKALSKSKRNIANKEPEWNFFKPVRVNGTTEMVACSASDVQKVVNNND